MPDPNLEFYKLQRPNETTVHLLNSTFGSVADWSTIYFSLKLLPKTGSFQCGVVDISDFIKSTYYVNTEIPIFHKVHFNTQQSTGRRSENLFMC